MDPNTYQKQIRRKTIKDSGSNENYADPNQRQNLHIPADPKINIITDLKKK